MRGIDIHSEKISGTQVTMLLITTMLTPAIIVAPEDVAILAGRDGWLAAVAATALGFANIALYLLLARYSPPGQDLAQVIIGALGTVAGRALVLLYAAFFLYLAAGFLRQFGDLMVYAIFPETPVEAIIVMLAALAAVTAFLGIEVTSRANGLVLPLVLLPAPVVIGLLVPGMRFEELLPVLAEGPGRVLRGAMPLWGFMGLSIFVPFLAPQLNQPDELAWVYPLSLLVVGGATAATMLALISFFGASQLARLTAPVLVLTRSVQVGEFITGLDPVVVAFWVGGNYIASTVFLYSAARAFSRAAGLSDYRPVVFPMGALVVTLSIIMFDSMVDITEFIAGAWSVFAPSMELGIPALVLLAIGVRMALGRRGGNRAPTALSQAPGGGEP